MHSSKHIGGKANALTRLRKGKFRVPPFFVCDDSWSAQQVHAALAQNLPNAKYFAVRSSASQEDSKERSFAGQFYSALGVANERVPEEIKKVQESFDGMPGAVIVQEFIASDAAGVMFTEADGSHIIINALTGLCEPVVSGRHCDEYICDKKGGLIDKTIPTVKEIKVFKDGLIVTQQSRGESLTHSQLKHLTRLAREIQAFFKSPQDVEWCLKGETLYVLQARPITRPIQITAKKYFDSANIAESYSGVVLPLTCSFAEHVYTQVYKDLLRMSGVSSKKIAQHPHIFEHLLGFFYGRMYYNMNNWYQLGTFVPGYKRNKENFELMITSNVRQTIATPIQPSLILTMLYPIIVLTKTAVFGFTARHFKKHVDRQLLYFQTHTFEQANYAQCAEGFRRLHEQLLRRWYITVENDFFVMTYLGILKKLLGEEQLQALIPFRSKATEQVGALAQLSQKMQAEPAVWQAALSDDVRAFTKALKEVPELSALLQNYLLKFGGRFASELKLESVGIDEDPAKLFPLLKIYASYSPKPYHGTAPVRLPFSKKILVSLVLKKFKKYASQREEFRLLRSNTFAVSRRLFRRMGHLLAEEGALERLDDVFYLHLNELLGANATNFGTFKKKIAQRKKECVLYAQVTPPTHFATVNDIPPPIFEHAGLSGSPLHGKPASPGVIRGRVKIFKEFSMPESIDFEILVTSHTDPGWTSLIAVSKGLIIEHGGVLSHASIVARELQIPAVIGAEGATSSLKDGQMVEINGSTGTVTLL